MPPRQKVQTEPKPNNIKQGSWAKGNTIGHLVTPLESHYEAALDMYSTTSNLKTSLLRSLSLCRHAT